MATPGMIPPPPDGSGVVAQAPPPPPDGSGVVSTAQQSDPGHDAVHAEIKAAPGGVRGWLNDLEGDIKYGQGNTFVGRALQALGAQGTSRGAQASAGGILTSPVLGPVHTAQGIAETPDHPLRGAWDTAKGVAETATIPGMIADPMGANGTAAMAERAAGAVSKGVKAAKSALWVTSDLKNASNAARPVAEITAEAAQGLSSKVAPAIDKVAADAGADTSGIARISTKAQVASDAYKTKAQELYTQLDKLAEQVTGNKGVFQRLRTAVQDAENELAQPNITGADQAAAQEKLANATKQYEAFKQVMVDNKVDPKMIKQADTLWARGAALDEVANKFRIGEDAAGNLKSSTAPLNNQVRDLTSPAASRGHILNQALGNPGTKGVPTGAAADILSATNDAADAVKAGKATNQAAKAADKQIKAIRTRQKILAGALGAGAVVKGKSAYDALMSSH